ncbi:hypothetical protein CKM354_000567400 [Cercospora kikuchii]|uniref:Uncharacterized protein n=1 Tax=Cercospora kikuchii TaxID=84275 RepID=A0A9P3CGQ1_9PEZI|nr:uncharacterized protein CKM354_000567400 [Cercospora kikuchii]GIZ42401.1 hypothetical protein CKM354_000567400 [Cercospora kikuchii]
MLLGQPTRVGLSHADIKDYQTRFEARQPSRQTPFRIGGVRLSSVPSHITRASITRAHENTGRMHADSCSSQAAICSADALTQQDLPNRFDQPAIPLLDPGAPIFVPRLAQGSASFLTEGNIDRYPPFRRPALPKRTSSRRHHTSSDHDIRPHDDVREQQSHRSSPNLLAMRSPPSTHGPRIRTRSSSLTWERTNENKSQKSRVVSSANGIDSRASALTTVPLDLLHRDSPLDELSQQLSRLAAGVHRPRSVGRSFERRPDRGISLLSGNPFDVSGESEMPDLPNELSNLSSPISKPVDNAKNRRDSLVDPQDLYELSLALPSPQVQPLPDLSHSGQQQAMSPSRDVDSSSSIPCGTPKGPPHVNVYDDSLPMSLQPQTPADLVRSTARRYRHSPSSSRRIHGELVSSPLSAVPERASNRQTYPMSNSRQESVTSDTPVRAPAVTPARHTLFVDHRASPMQPRQSPIYQSSTPIRSPQHDLVRHHNHTTQQQIPLRQSRRQERTGNSENDIEAALEAVEQDRHTWVSRREQHGELDVTPPAEGRFERYFT